MYSFFFHLQIFDGNYIAPKTKILYKIDLATLKQAVTNFFFPILAQTYRFSSPTTIYESITTKSEELKQNYRKKEIKITTT